MVWPNGSETIPSVSSEFNPSRRNPVTGVVQPHQGIDLVGWDVVRAPFAGTIIMARYDGGYGNHVKIRRPNGDVVSMAHNRAFIRTSGQVNAGDPVAYQGSTGNSTGKHTHYETRPGGGAAVNPRGYMAAQGSSGVPANVGGGQRTAGANGVRRRSEPRSSAPEAGEMLAPGTVGNFTGWIHGESVSGNNVWYRGTSGHWFWSGGFVEGANGTGLTDLNPSTPPANVGGGERTAGPDGVRRRSQPSSSSPEAGEMLAPGTVGNFTGWIHGESVSGNNVWYRGISGDWFWSGGFVEGANGTGLTDLNPSSPPVTPPVPPVASNERTAGPDGARRRSLPSSKAAEAGALLAPGVVGTFNAWTHGEAVSGNDVWYRGISGDWFWSGGFTSTSTDGLPEVAAPTEPTTPPVVTPPKDADNPRGLPTYQPFYPGAFIGLEAPLGDAPRGQKGLPPNVVSVPVIIDQFHLHRTGSSGDDGDWFSYRNSRSSCPHLHVLQDGRTREFIRPKMKPALSGPEWNWRGYGIEIQGAGDGTPEQFERVADIMAWLASYEGRELDGVPVTYNLRHRAGVTVTHREMVATECPGDWWVGQVDALLERARVLLDEKYSPEPDPEPVPSLPAAVRVVLERVVDEINGVLGR